MRAKSVLATARIWAVLFGMLLGSWTSAGDYHVSFSGSDLAGDGTATNPWRTINHALKSIPDPTPTVKHTIHIGPGHWHYEVMEPFPLQIPPGVVLEGAGIDLTILSGVRANSRQPVPAYGQVLVQILVPVGGTPAGIAPPELTNLTLMHARSAVEVTGDTASAPAPNIHNCKFWKNQVGLTNTNGAPRIEQCDFDSNTIGISSGRITEVGETTTISQCRFYKNSYGINAANSMKMTIEYNRFELNGVGIMMGTVGLVTVQPLLRNNTYFMNGQGYTGMAVLGGKTLPTLVHETFYGNNTGIASLDDYVFGGQSNPNIRNSIIWGSIEWDLNGVSQEEVHNSNLSTATGVPFGPIIGVNGIMAEEPRFVDPENGDLHLRDDSPVIDKGLDDTSGKPELDLDGEPRAVGYPDLGVDESLAFLVHSSAGCSPREMKLILTARADPGLTYVLAASYIYTRDHGILLGGRVLPLYPDCLFYETCGFNGKLSGFTGVLSGAGQAIVKMDIPDRPLLRGSKFHVAFVTLSPQAASGIKTISNVVTVEADKL